MKPALAAVGAAVLVLGLGLIFASPSIVEQGIYRSEFSQIGATSVNSTSIQSTISYYANFGEVVLILGVIIAPLGAAMTVYGMSSKPSEDAGKQATPFTEPPQT
jgi:hypothetical protein